MSGDVFIWMLGGVSQVHKLIKKMDSGCAGGRWSTFHKVKSIRLWSHMQGEITMGLCAKRGRCAIIIFSCGRVGYSQCCY